ncbi:enoyl-CoA hydratase/isomerase family protein [Paraburkholderia phymatum]|uniref:Enoyl-CoA hydratase/isomerase n=1 Tax=Paraburkholderia phymatum (strain DSM 17167 / CIP 108236 / LMG 21445 / STM815) TaxID=391038 RepID=B2JSH2_PARP8|nr:enoyl-CoA hydratase/isomerase family protein [Paraburkholderia phymatum]ACC73992.1 Enoyl-CoA hydratase/isomerase [Paraburkholderia phymatum STM815]
MSVISFEQQGNVGHIVLADGPLNLINNRFCEALKDAVHEASRSEIRALLVRAEGANFSHGGDVLDFIDKDFDDWRTFISEMNQSYRGIEALQIPTVAAVRGACFGGAFELALACDLIVAADNAVFHHFEASVGSAPVAGGVQRLAERAGRAIAARYTMLSEPMTGKTAGELGVAAFACAETDVESTAASLVTRLSNGPTRSYAAIRSLLKAWAGGGVPAADSVLLDITMPLHGTEDARKGRTARVEAIRRGVEPEPVLFTGQ